MTLRRFEASAPAKLILVGEHAVVHGYPALVLPFSACAARAVVTAIAGPARFAAFEWEGPLDTAPERLAGLAACARATCDQLGIAAEGFALQLGTEIPPGSGLGASAALAVALVRALYGACDRAPTIAETAALAAVAERHAHGNPSGVDVAGVLATGPLRFVRGEPPRAIAPGAPLHLVVADTGKPSATKAAVAALQARLALEDEGVRTQLKLLGEAADAACDALAAGDGPGLGVQMDAAQTALAALALSDAALEALVQTSRAHGALGAKLTGGGRGGCMLALAADAESQAAIAQALAAAGAARVWRHTVTREAVCS